MKHTHRGTCQICGAVQAFNRGLAKHGYTVTWGFFNGVCNGADHQPLERDKTVAENTIKRLREEVVPQARAARHGLQNKSIEPAWYLVEKLPNFKSKKVPAKREQLTAQQIEQQTCIAILNETNRITGALEHAIRLEQLIAARHGQELYPVERDTKKVVKEGVNVRVGGKTGWVGKVLTVRNVVAKGCGPYMNGRVMPHAFIRTPKDTVIQVPTRTIRQDAILP